MVAHDYAADSYISILDYGRDEMKKEIGSSTMPVDNGLFLFTVFR